MHADIVCSTAYRDRNTGRSSNKDKPTGEENARPDRRMDRHSAGTYEGRGRGGRTGRGGAYDRHSRGVGGLVIPSANFKHRSNTLHSESEKQAAHGWGANEGGAELADEQAGEAIAKADEKEALTGDAEGGDAVVEAPEPEPEDTSVSYSEYLAQQAEKKLNLGKLEVRKVDDSKVDKKWANAKAVTKEEEEDFVAGSGGKAKRERERAAKNVKLDIDQRFVEQPREERGGRGGFRGGRGGRGDGARGGARGDFRGGRGGDRGGRGRGEGRGGAPRHNNGPRGNSGPALKIDDNSAFPSLGA